MLQGVAALRDRKTGEENAAHDEEKKVGAGNADEDQR